MNHLAHAYLARENDDLIVGNFIADYARGAVDNLSYPEGIKEGIAMHRAIDTFTDSHEAIHTACAMLHASHHKYAPIVIDVCFDYFIAEIWHELLPQKTLHQFSTDVCNALHARHALLPPTLQKRLPSMIANNFLTHYRHYDGLTFAFESLARRTTFDHNLGKAVDDFKAHQAELKAIFEVFFPQLVAHIAKKDWLNYKK